MKWLDVIIDSMDMFEQALLQLLLLWEMVKGREASCPEVHGATTSPTRLSD